MANNPKFPTGQPYKKGSFIAQHQVKDSIDLTDDKAPSGIGCWEPASSANAPGASSKTRRSKRGGQPPVHKKKLMKLLKKAQLENVGEIPVPPDNAPQAGSSIKWELNPVDDDVIEATPKPEEQKQVQPSPIKLTIQPKKTPQPSPLVTSESRWKPFSVSKTKPAPTFIETDKNKMAPKNAGKPKMAPTFVETAINKAIIPVKVVEVKQNKPKMAATFVDTSINKAIISVKVEAVKKSKPERILPERVLTEVVGTPKIAPKSDFGGNKNYSKTVPKESPAQANKTTTNVPKPAKPVKITNIGGGGGAHGGFIPIGPGGAIRGPAGVPKSFLASQGWIKDQIMPQVDYTNQQTFTPNIPRSIPTQEAEQMYVDTSAVESTEPRQQYSPSDIYNDSMTHGEQGLEGDGESPEQHAQKRLSAFQRLGPQSKKPKLTINLMCDKEQSVREVRELEEIVPVHLRQDIIDSTNEIVVAFRKAWPWKTNLIVHRTVCARNSKSVMMLEQEQMEEYYERDSLFIMLTVKRYPPSWTKEDVLDALLEAVKGKTFIPCFVEFTREECKFLVIRSKQALIALHKLGFSIRKGDEVILKVQISKIDFSLNQLDFLPRLVLRKILAKGYDSERSLNLRAFTLQSDISHFIYFPLNRLFNQMELVQLQSAVVWEYLTDLDLSHNRLTSIDGFEFPKMTPRLKNLDLSFNYLERVTCLLRCTKVPLKSLKLEGNPLCHDYTDPDHYVKVVKMMFSTLLELDGIPIKLTGDLPPMKRNYCPADAKLIVDNFLEVFFPLLDGNPDDRIDLEDLYDEKARLTVTYEYKMRFNPSCRYYRNLLLKARVFGEGETDSIDGAAAIAKLLCRWPAIMHDANSFALDIMHHSETTTVVRISGIMKLTVATLAEDEHILAFTRTVVLVSKNGVEYKILNEMVYWEYPTAECADAAFKVNTVRLRKPSLKLDSAPSDGFKTELIKIFMKITDLDAKQSEKCLNSKDWNLKYALEYFMKLCKLDDFSCLLDDVKETMPKV